MQAATSRVRILIEKCTKPIQSPATHRPHRLRRDVQRVGNDVIWNLVDHDHPEEFLVTLGQAIKGRPELPIPLDAEHVVLRGQFGFPGLLGQLAPCSCRTLTRSCERLR